MENLEYKNLLDAGVHFGHLTRKWNPRMAPYIFMERNGIHIVDLNKTLACLDEANRAIRQIVRSGRKVLFVATKKQAKEVVTDEAIRLNMPYVTERWLGGMLTNFTTIRKSLKKMASIEKMMKEETYQNLAKRERLMITREKDKLHKVLGGISDLTRLPAALFVVDVRKEHIAVAEAQKLNIPVFAMVDTNSDPGNIDFPIPANDDAYKSIAIITQTFSKAIEEGLMERKKDKEDARLKEEEEAKKKADEKKGAALEQEEEDKQKKEDARKEKTTSAKDKADDVTEAKNVKESEEEKKEKKEKEGKAGKEEPEASKVKNEAEATAAKEGATK